MTDQQTEQLDAAPAGLPWSRYIIGAAIIAIATAIVYVPSLGGDFSWDDDTWLWNNRVIREHGGISDYWLAQRRLPDYLPLTSTAFHIQWFIFGRDPAGYRAVNIALHAAGAILVWFVLRRLGVGGAYLAALLFALHPVSAASVAWITELKNVLSLPLAAAALLAYLRFERTAHRRWYAVALALYAVALTAKASIVILPVVLLGCAWWQRRRVAPRDVWRSIPFFLLAAGAAAGTILTQMHWATKDTTIDPPANIWESLVIAGRAPWFYLSKALAPLGLSMIYPKWDIHHLSVLSFIPLAAALAVAVMLWRYRKGWARPIAFALGYYIIALAPTLGFVKMSYMAHSYVADHWHYLALIAPVALVVSCGWNFALRRGSRVRAAAVGVAVAAAAGLGYLTFRQSMLHGAPEQLWANAARQAPNSWAAHNNCGCAMSKAERLDLALHYLRRTVQIRPDHAKACRNMGIVFIKQGLKEKAIEAYARAVEIDPRFVDPLLRLGRLHAEAGRLDAAQKYLESAVRVVPKMALAHYRLGIVYGQQGKSEQALRRYGAAVLYDPKFAEGHNRLGMALFDRKDFQRAAHHFARAMELDPGDPFKHNNLGSALMAMDRLQEAVECYRKALALDAENASARRNLDLALRRLKAKP